MDKVLYRNATTNDISQILELWRCFWPPQSYENGLKLKITKDQDMVYVAEFNGKIIGTVIGGFDNWWA